MKKQAGQIISIKTKRSLPRSGQWHHNNDVIAQFSNQVPAFNVCYSGSFDFFRQSDFRSGSYMQRIQSDLRSCLFHVNLALEKSISGCCFINLRKTLRPRWKHARARHWNIYPPITRVCVCVSCGLRSLDSPLPYLTNNHNTIQPPQLNQSPQHINHCNKPTTTTIATAQFNHTQLMSTLQSITVSPKQQVVYWALLSTWKYIN